ncbi:QueT transporter family protein [Sedimentibacter sp. zth1]|uniref:QueT transporter family protein n=1 Tax=Sedimentibacter sp. zth1 TaxID=2816908 RepID=UPI001A914433|nr:QueT transporter family protein [Sedimentibacter sp. zth1]QSX06032.1 QueT transporter family protein [Sedimentibacter sp. zth1]
MDKNKVKFITKSAIVAALYAAITFAFAGLSYGQIQFRISEILVLLVFVDRKYFWGLVLGCIISNAASPLGIVDVFAGTLATSIALAFIIFVREKLGDNNKALIIASLGPVISNAIIVGIELTVLFKEMPFIINAAYVALGEFVVVTIAGVVVFAKMKNVIKKVASF